jgi:polyphosphate kinase
MGQATHEGHGSAQKHPGGKAETGPASTPREPVEAEGAVKPELELVEEKPETESQLIDLHDPAYYVNRELSRLQFDRRVLEEAEDSRNPLLERLKFLAISDSNLDEFFMVRVAGLKQQIAAGVVDLPPDGMTPAEQLAAVRKAALRLMVLERQCLNDVLAQLADAGIRILDHDELTGKQKTTIKRHFDEMLFPVLTPLAFDPGRPFPFISNLSLNLAVIVRDQGEERFARLKVPRTLPGFFPLKRSSGSVRRDGTVPHNHYFVPLDQIIMAHLDRLFPGVDIIEVHPFHVTRDADVEIQELEASDLLETIEETVRQRRFGSVVRVAVNRSMPDRVRELLVHELGVHPNDVYTLDGPLTLRSLMSLASIERRDLREASFIPSRPPRLDATPEPGVLFDSIRQQDILLHHPFDSFAPVVDFLETAAHDPDVLAIKMTLYRVGRDSPVVDALLEAAQNRKQVSVLVELKARFDEESNIGWARKLEEQGVHVVYGLLGLKTHSKVALVVRKEGDRIRRYVHLSTGNYNQITAHLYTDLGLFTCREEIGADATDLFNYLTGYSRKSDYRKLIVAPINLRSRIKELIQREIDHHRRGRKGRLIFKMNALVDKTMIRWLYRASQAGVEIDLIVRGICCLRPGVPGVSENIRVTSIVGRFLEHSRVYYFGNGGNEEVFLASADLMTRNIDRRVEVVFPVEDPGLVRQLRDEVLAVYLADNARARIMQPDGSYVRARRAADEALIDSQAELLERARKARSELKESTLGRGLRPRPLE